ncbi:MAG TPA: TIGR03617 family F420-dependent LLM class oxidoreductase [Pseudomonadales bacterium]|nr:TIGR03617 family F420-dependent LLM class oxidoreductase [Pseudomonadales bacterium]
MFRIYASTPENMQLHEIAAHAQRAEAMGFDGLNIPDSIHDGLLLSALALNATTKLTVGTGVLVAFPRSPMTVAIAAWDLQRLSNGRFELGLGTQVKGNIENRYSTTWTAPMPRMRDYIGSVRAIFNSFQHGVPLQFESDNYHFTRLQPFFNPGPLDCIPPPIFIGAVGPLMTALAGEAADGIITHPTNTPSRYLHEVTLPRLQQGITKAARKKEDVRLILGNIVATGKDDAAVTAEREKQRKLLGFLYSTPAYWPSLELFGWQDKGEQLLQCTRNNDWHNMAKIIDDEMLDTFAPCASYDTIADVIATRYEAINATINFPVPEHPDDDSAVADVIRQLKSME